jgi:hypothetical protein
MTQEETMHIEELDGKLERIQRSTRTAIPFFTPIHNTLRSKSKLYYNWHLKAFANTLHWVFLVAFTLGMATSVGAYYFLQGNPVQAASANRYWVGGDGTWDAADTTHWSASSGGAGGVSVPDNTDTVIVDANSGSGTITLGAAYSPTIVGINYNRAAITTDLNTNTLTISANDSTTFTFTAGTVNNGTFVIAGGTSNTATFAGGTFGADVTVTAGNITLSAATFNGATNSFTKTGANQNASNGGNTFGASSTTTFYYSAATTAYWSLASTTGNTYNGHIVVENTGGGILYVADSSATSPVTSTLADTKTITVGAHGFTAGTLRFIGFTQTGGSTAQTLALTDAAKIYFEGSNVFAGDLTVTAPDILLNGGVFNGATNIFQKTGTGTNTSVGGNTFGPSSTTTFYLSAASGTWTLAGTTGNTYNGHIKVENAGSGNLYVADNGTFDATSTLANTKTITVGANGFASGVLYFYGFTQTGDTAQTLVLTSTADVRFATGTIFGAGLTVSAPNIYLNGATFNGTTNSFTKTGTTENICTGGNNFAAGTSTTFTYNGASSNWRFGYTNPDTYTGNVEFINASTGTVHVAWAGTNDFGGNLTLTPGSGIIGVGAGGGTAQFSKASDTQTLSSGGVTIPLLTHTGAGTLQLASALTSTTLTNSAGTLDLNGQNLTVTTYSNTATLQLNGDETTVSITNDSDSGLTKFVKTTGTITIKNLTPYYNVEFDSNVSGDGDAVFTLPADTVVNGNLTITDGTLDASSSNRNLTVAGNWVNTSNEATAFNARAATVTFNGAVAQTISGSSPWYNLSINNTAGSPSDTVDVDPSAIQTVTNLLRVIDGQWTPYTGDNYTAVQIDAAGIMKPDTSASITVSGNWTNSGTFTHNSSLVTLDGTSQTIAGDTTFYDLTKNVTAADTLTFTASSTQTVAHTLDLQGASGHLLSLRSSVSGTQWNLIHDAVSYTTSYLDIKDSNHTGGASFMPLVSTDSGNNIGWTIPFRYAISSASSSTTPGSAITATLTVQDTNGATINTTGDVSIAFTGASTSTNNWIPTATDKTGTAVQFGTATTIALTNGIGTTTITPYKTETSSITATDTNSITTTTPLALTVGAPTATVSINSPNSQLPTPNYYTSSSITATLTLSNTNGTATSGSSSPTYRLAESTSAVSSASSQVLTSNPLSPITYNLTPTDGYHTLYALLTDTYGNSATTASSQTIILDVTAPTAPANLTAYSAHDTTSPASATQKIYGSVLTFTPSADTGSGFKGYAITRDNTLLDADPDNATLTKQTNINTTKDTAGQPVTYYIDPTLTSASQSATYKITAIDNAGNTSSQEVSFSPSGKTIEATFAPATVTKIEDIKTTYSENASQDNDNTMVATINWITDAPATEAIRYGQSCDQLTDSSQKDQNTGQDTAPAYNTNHSVTLSNLDPETNYCAQLTATDPNQKTVTALETFTTPATSQTKSLFEVIWDKIENFFSMLWQAIRSLFGYHTASAADTTPKDLHVAPVLDSHDRFIGNALYFPPQTDTVSIKRNNAEIGNSQNNRYLDLTAKEGERYTYTVSALTNEQKTGLKGGLPTITNVQAKLIAVLPDTASVEVSWLTTGIPSTGFVKYGTATNTYTGEAKQDGYNESHKVLINDLSPDSSYYFQVTSISADNQSATGQEISYTVPEAQKAKSVFVIIYEALVKAFGGFVSWLYR